MLRSGDSDPKTVLEIDSLANLEPGYCDFVGRERFGAFFADGGAFQRVAVSPDGTSIVFEVSNLSSTQIPPEDSGFFAVHADGSGLRRLAPPSARRTFLSSGGAIQTFPDLAFSPSGGRVVYTDAGPTDDPQVTAIALLDVQTGERHLIPGIPPLPATVSQAQITCCTNFFDENTVSFTTSGDPDGSNPDHARVIVTVHTDGSDLSVTKLPPVLSESAVLPNFSVIGTKPHPLIGFFPGPPVNPEQSNSSLIQEILLLDNDNELQLTNFRRGDTSGALIDEAHGVLTFVASADPFGDNPSFNCQVFSIASDASELKQLTRFSEADRSLNGCTFRPAPGCAIGLVAQDAQAGSLVFYSSCDAFGTGAYGAQAFAVRPDGSGLRQLTSAAGRNVLADGSVTVDLPSFFAYGPTNP